MADPIKTGIMKLEAAGEIGFLWLDNGIYNLITELDFLDLSILRTWIEANHFKGIIISSKGRNFSSGVNVANLKKDQENMQGLKKSLEKCHAILDYIECLPLITIAAISGVCFGGGLEIALSCNFRFCAENSNFAFPEINRDLMPGGAGTFRLPRLIGYPKAVKMIISGDIVSAEEAKESGLVDYITPKKAAVEQAIHFLKRLTYKKNSDSIKKIMTSLNTNRYLDKNETIKKETELFLQLVENLGDLENITM